MQYGWMLPAFFFSIALIWVTVTYWPRSREGLFEQRDRRFMHSAAERGLSSAEMNEEYLFRVSWVRLRRRVSEAAIQWPEGYARKLAEITKEEANQLAAIDKGLAKRFLNVVENAEHSEILYPEALRLVLAAEKQLTPVYGQPSDDEIAAVRTL